MMKKEKPVINKVGVWMDHAEAQLINPEQPEKVQKIRSPLNGRIRIAGEGSDTIRLGNNRSTNNEWSKHSKEKNALHSYFKQIADALKPYDEVFVFGPTTAPKEFHNYILDNKELPGKRMRSRKADYMTKKERIAHVKDFFSNKNSMVNPRSDR